MTENPQRRRLLQLSLAALPTFVTLNAAAATQSFAEPGASSSGPEHDFDFFLGSWSVRHRRLKQRLAGSNDWEEFAGTTTCWSLLGGLANLNDSLVHRPGSTGRGLGLRAYDSKTNTWADWWLDGRNPTRIDAPGIGRFENGIGTFLSEDVFEARPIKVRGVFSSLSPSVAQWEQAFSPDGGKTWETNWVMRYTRTA